MFQNLFFYYDFNFNFNAVPREPTNISAANSKIIHFWNRLTTVMAQLKAFTGRTKWSHGPHMAQ